MAAARAPAPYPGAIERAEATDTPAAGERGSTMDPTQIADAAAAWLDVWRHGSAHPAVVLAALRRLAAQARDLEARAVVEHAQLVAASVPFGSVQAFVA